MCLSFILCTEFHAAFMQTTSYRSCPYDRKVERAWLIDHVDYALKCLELFNEKIDIYESNGPTIRSIFCHLDGFICQISSLKLFTTTIIVIITIIVFLIVEVNGATAVSRPWPLLGFSAIRVLKFYPPICNTRLSHLSILISVFVLFSFLRSKIASHE